MTDRHSQPSGPERRDGAEAAAGRAHTTTAGWSEPAAPADTDDSAVVLRTKDGWRVGGMDMPDLTSAMVLADLLSAELAATAGADAADGSHRRGDEPPAGRATDVAAGETGRLRTTIGQLEHALSARVRIEQAIGVLAERHRIKPRQAFEQLRTAARNRGRRVIDIATDVVASATNPLLQLPDELSRPRSPGRRARQARGLVGTE